MQETFGLQPLAMDDAHQGRQRPKIEDCGGPVVAVLRLVVALWRNDVFARSRHVRPPCKRSLLGVREHCEREPDRICDGSGLVPRAHVNTVVDSRFPVAETLDGEQEETEARDFAIGSARLNTSIGSGHAIIVTAIQANRSTFAAKAGVGPWLPRGKFSRRFPCHACPAMAEFAALSGER